MAKKKPTNWKRIMKALIESGHDYNSIIKETGIGRSTLSRLATDKTKILDYDTGLKLMKLYVAIG